MTQTELNRAVARATGESVNRVVRMGFNEVVVPIAMPWWRSRRRRKLRARHKRHTSSSTKASSTIVR